MCGSNPWALGDPYVMAAESKFQHNHPCNILITKATALGNTRVFLDIVGKTVIRVCGLSIYLDRLGSIRNSTNISEGSPGEREIDLNESSGTYTQRNPPLL